MKDNEVVNLELQLSTDQAEANTNKITTSIEDLEKNMCTAVNELTKVITVLKMKADALISSVKQMTVPITELAKSLNMITALDFSTLVTELSNLRSTLNDIFEQKTEQQVQNLAADSFSSAIDAAQLGFDIYKMFGGNSSKSKDKNNGGIRVKVRKKGKSSKSDASGIAAGGIGTVLGLDALDGTLGDILSDATEGVGGLSGAFDNIVTKIKDSTAATWLQNAATTAWQGISTAATAVTTAFGAAMNFLTSPIGLVVLAITALIAIIVLLIANWDTVKAAVLTAWEAIKNAFAVAMDWISTKVQEGMAFMQSIFAGISEFMQGVFAKDWSEQFGAFGNVLNAFLRMWKMSGVL